MKINDRLQWLYELRGKQIKLGLEPTRKFLSKIEMPVLPYPVIHVAGTNGKGSTSFFIYKILLAHGLDAGLYTSPHIEKFNERIRVNDKLISTEQIENFLEKYESYIEETEITFFEATTAMAMEYFAKEKVDVVVLETGLGGRFDATNVVDPSIVVLTHIAMDHENFLGDSLIAIAKEKLGIVKSGRNVFSSPQQEEITPQIENYCKNLSAKLSFVFPQEIKMNGPFSTFALHGKTYKIVMPGLHQVQNASLALEVAKNFLGEKYSSKIAQQTLPVVKWPGRIEIVSDKPLIIFDAAHNESSLKALLGTLDIAFPNKKWIAIMAVMADKDLTAVLSELHAKFSKIWCRSFNYHRALSASHLRDLLQNAGIDAELLPQSGLANLIKSVEEDTGIVVLGTHYILAETRKQLNRIKRSLKA
jgi:dihydrofolate synthase / folylpolyglutamate synthase